jgi:hypothetical protein
MPHATVVQTMGSRAREYAAIQAELTEVNQRATALRRRRAEVGEHLRQHMIRNGVDAYSGITLRSLEPRRRTPRLSAAEKRASAVALFRSIGVTRPEDFWEELQTTQQPAAADDDGEA